MFFYIVSGRIKILKLVSLNDQDNIVLVKISQSYIQVFGLTPPHLVPKVFLYKLEISVYICRFMVFDPFPLRICTKLTEGTVSY